MRGYSRRRALRVAIAVAAAALLVLVSALPTWAMTLTFVRHAESQANAAGVIDTSVPGPGLSPLGFEQAEDAALALVGNDYDGIYVSSMLRTQQTADPLVALLPPGTTYEILPGLREISAGIFEGSSEDEGLGRLGYVLAPVAWLLGARFVPVLGGEDGNAFDARVDAAVERIFDNGDENAVAFAHGATIMFWVLMNVDNPDLGLLLTHQLDNTETVVIEGTPEEGWTLVSWAGIPVAADPPLVTKLFVAVRDLVVAPQTALYNVGRAFATGDVAALATAVRDGFLDVGRAVTGFVPRVVGDIAGSVSEAVGAPAAAPSVDDLTVRSVNSAPMSEDPPPADDVADGTRKTVKTEPDAVDATSVKRNGATDLTDGNKAVPGQAPVGVATPDNTADLEQIAEVSEISDDPTTDTDTDDADIDADTDASADAPRQTAA